MLLGGAGLVSACGPRPGPTPLLPPQADDRLLFAQAHLQLRPELAAQHFDCAVGARLTARSTPALTQALTQVAEAVTRAAPPDRRPAPPPEAVCVRLLPGEGATGTVSRRAALARGYGLVLAHLAPDRAGAIEVRARDVAEAERLCGLADAAAIDRGWTLGTNTFALLESEEAFAGLLVRAAAEVAQARGDPIESPACAAERRSLSPPPVSG